MEIPPSINQTWRGTETRTGGQRAGVLPLTERPVCLFLALASVPALCLLHKDLLND